MRWFECTLLAASSLAWAGCYDGTDPGQDEGDGSTAGEGSDEAGTQNDEGNDEAGTEAGEPEPGLLARGIHLDTIELNQAVGIALAAGGQIVPQASRDAPIVAGRPALVRASWTLDADFEPRMIRARLILTEGENNYVYETEQFIDGPPNWGELEGALVWKLGADAIAGNTELAVELLEIDEGRSPAAADEGARLPVDGGSSLAAMDGPMTLKVMVVPATDPDADPTPFTITDAFLDQLEVNLYDMYPVREVQLEVHEPINLTACYDGPAVMADLSAIRNAENLGDDWYYHAIVGNSNEVYCNTGGYAWLLEDEYPGADRVSFSINHWGESPNNWVHELGHSHGRPHSWEDQAYDPAAADGPDCGRRATWGWPLLPGEHPKAEEWDFTPMWTMEDWLIAPTQGLGLDGYCLGHDDFDSWGPAMNDMMSYAFPYWIGAHTYRELAQRVSTVSSYGDGGLPGDARQAPARSLHIVFLADGSMRSYEGPGWPDRLQSGDEKLRVTLLDHEGHSSRELNFAPKRGSKGEVHGLILPLGDTGPNAVSGGNIGVHLGPSQHTIEIGAHELSR